MIRLIYSQYTSTINLTFMEVFVRQPAMLFIFASYFNTINIRALCKALISLSIFSLVSSHLIQRFHSSTIFYFPLGKEITGNKYNCRNGGCYRSFVLFYHHFSVYLLLIYFVLLLFFKNPWGLYWWWLDYLNWFVANGMLYLHINLSSADAMS